MPSGSIMQPPVPVSRYRVPVPSTGIPATKSILQFWRETVGPYDFCVSEVEKKTVGTYCLRRCLRTVYLRIHYKLYHVGAYCFVPEGSLRYPEQDPTRKFCEKMFFGRSAILRKKNTRKTAEFRPKYRFSVPKYGSPGPVYYY